MLIPDSPAEVLPDPSPIVRPEGGSEAAMEYLDRVIFDASEYRGGLARVGRDLDELRGNAARGLSERVNRLGEGAFAVQTSAEGALFSLRDYAGSILEIHSRARVVEREVEASLRAIRRAAAQIEEVSRRVGVWVDLAWDAPPRPEMPRFRPKVAEAGSAVVDEASREQWARAAQMWRAAVEAILLEKRRWHALTAERRERERALIVALGETEIGRLLPPGAGLGARDTSVFRAMVEGLTPDRPWEPREVRALISGELSADAAGAAWERLVASDTDIDRLLEQYCFELAGIDGIPFWAQDRAGRTALRYALENDEHLLEAFRRMGFGRSEHSILEFKRDLETLQEEIGRADLYALPAQLIALGRHDGAVTAGISFGDLDTASVVGVFVSGMRSDVRQIGDTSPAFRTMRGKYPGMALVIWAGYRAPGLGEEPFQDRAERGRFALASFLHGVSVQRRSDPVDRVVLIGHSYGSNVAAEALKISDSPVDALVTIGSAGLAYGTSMDQLHTRELHATHAQGDNIAALGRLVHVRAGGDGGGLYEARVDPRALLGARVFSSERSADGKAVTMHNLVNPIDWGPFQGIANLDGHTKAEEVGYLDPESSTVKRLREIMEGGYR